jgi:hypothetical protein
MSTVVATGGSQQPMRTLIDALQSQLDAAHEDRRELTRELVAEKAARQRAEDEALILRSANRRLREILEERDISLAKLGTAPAFNIMHAAEFAAKPRPTGRTKEVA